MIKTLKQKTDRVGIGFIGAGSYAQSHLIPNIPKNNDVALIGVKTATSASARSVAERYGFNFCTGEENDIYENKDVNTVFIATRHNTHADFVIRSLKAGKHVFVEKPICLNPAELDTIKETYISDLSLMVGYNRRFSPLAQKIKDTIKTAPMSMLYRINAGNIPADSWIQDLETGGGRILGEVCHFVDFLTFMNGSLPVSVYGTVMDDPSHMNDVLNVSLTYQNGSIGTISYYSNGAKSFSKEYVEIYGHGSTAVLNDYKELKIYGTGKPYAKKLLVQDKGQKQEVKLFIDAIKKGTATPISIEEIFNTAEVCFGIIESIRTRLPVKI